MIKNKCYLSNSMISHNISMAKIKKKVICVDIDGTICSQRKFDYENAVPNKLAISKVNELFEKGATILVYTARYMGKEKGDIEKVIRNGYSFTYKQLKSWGLKFHKLKMGKPNYDIIIDDKAYGYNENWIDDLK